MEMEKQMAKMQQDQEALLAELASVRRQLANAGGGGCLL